MHPVFVRIDTRLVHGQVIEAWLPYTKATAIIVANDALAADSVRQQIMTLAIPQRFAGIFSRVEEVMGVLDRLTGRTGVSLVLFSNCADARRALESGFRFSRLNVGNVHYAPGKRQLTPSVAVDPAEEACLRFFQAQDVDLDFRCVPGDTTLVNPL